jgi:protein SCO1/2
MKLFQTALFVLGALLLAGCQKEPASSPPAAAEPVAAVTATNSQPAAPTSPSTNRFFLVHGVVKEVNPAEKTVTVQHEKIADYMDAMTMPFKAKDAAELQGLEPGDSIWFVLRVFPDESWIEKIRKDKKQTGPAPQASAPAEREEFRIARDVDPLNVGDLMPDYHFTNELGQAVSLGDFKGQALAFTFIFTRCPLPDFCPRMSKNFAEVCQKLKAIPDGPTNWHLLTITFDPTFDTPEVLRGYSQAFQNDPKRWNFVTGAMIDIDAITDQFSLIIVRRGNEWDHKVRTVVVDANGRIQNIIYGNEWKPDALVEAIVKAAHPAPVQQALNK